MRALAPLLLTLAALAALSCRPNLTATCSSDRECVKGARCDAETSTCVAADASVPGDTCSASTQGRLGWECNSGKWTYVGLPGGRVPELLVQRTFGPAGKTYEITASFSANRFGFDCKSPEADGCCLLDFSPPSVPSSVSGGPVDVRIGSTSYALNFEGTSYVRLQVLAFGPGDLVTGQFDGNTVDLANPIGLPEATVPSDVSVGEPDIATGQATVSRSSGLRVTWVPSGKGDIRIQLGYAPNALQCQAPDPAGSFTIPAARLASLPPGNTPVIVSRIDQVFAPKTATVLYTSAQGQILLQ